MSVKTQFKAINSDEWALIVLKRCGGDREKAQRVFALDVAQNPVLLDDLVRKHFDHVIAIAKVRQPRPVSNLDEMKRKAEEASARRRLATGALNDVSKELLEEWNIQLSDGANIWRATGAQIRADLVNAQNGINRLAKRARYEQLVSEHLADHERPCDKFKPKQMNEFYRRAEQ